MNFFRVRHPADAGLEDMAGGKIRALASRVGAAEDASRSQETAIDAIEESVADLAARAAERDAINVERDQQIQDLETALESHRAAIESLRHDLAAAGVANVNSIAVALKEADARVGAAVRSMRDEFEFALQGFNGRLKAAESEVAKLDAKVRASVEDSVARACVDLDGRVDRLMIAESVTRKVRDAILRGFGDLEDDGFGVPAPVSPAPPAPPVSSCSPIGCSPSSYSYECCRSAPNSFSEGN